MIENTRVREAGRQISGTIGNLKIRDQCSFNKFLLFTSLISYIKCATVIRGCSRMLLKQGIAVVLASLVIFHVI